MASYLPTYQGSPSTSIPEQSQVAHCGLWRGSPSSLLTAHSGGQRGRPALLACLLSAAARLSCLRKEEPGAMPALPRSPWLPSKIALCHQGPTQPGVVQSLFSIWGPYSTKLLPGYLVDWVLSLLLVLGLLWVQWLLLSSGLPGHKMALGYPYIRISENHRMLYQSRMQGILLTTCSNFLISQRKSFFPRLNFNFIDT